MTFHDVHVPFGHPDEPAGTGRRHDNLRRLGNRDLLWRRRCGGGGRGRRRGLLRGPLLREFLASTLKEADMLMAPVLGQPVPTLAACNPSTTDRSAAGMATLPYWTRWVNYLGVPAIAVPCGIDSAGLPVSFQLVGRPFREDLLLRAAHAYQEATDWHLRIPSGAS